MKQHQNEVYEIRAEKQARATNPLTLVAQQQPIYHPKPQPSNYTKNSITRSQPAATRNRGKAIVNSPTPSYDQAPIMDVEDEEMSKEKEIDKLMALISLSFKKIYKPTNNNLRTSSNTCRANLDNFPRTSKGTGYDNQRTVNVAGARETVGTPRDDADDDDEPEKQELEAHYMYRAQIQEVSADVADDSGPIFDTEPLQKVHNDDDNYNVFANDRQHPEQPESINNTYPDDQGDKHIILDSLDMSINGGEADQDAADLDQERDLLASLIEKLKCKIDESKNRNKLLESSNKMIVDKLKSEIESFKHTTKSLESSNTHLNEANNELKKTNQMTVKDLVKFQDEIKRHSDVKHSDVKYMSKVEIDCAKAKTDLMSYKTEAQKSMNNYSYQITELNKKISDLNEELVAHQETISNMSKQKEAQKKIHKTRENKELDKYLKKAKIVNPRLYDIGCYKDNLALILAPESDKSIRHALESRSKLSVKCCKDVITNNTGYVFINQTISSTIKTNLDPQIHELLINTDKFLQNLKEEMVDDVRYFNSLKQEVDSLKSQLETQKTQFLNEFDRLSREFYYADHMNAILGVYTDLDEHSELACNYLETLEKCQNLGKELSKKNNNVNFQKYNELSRSFAKLQQHSISLEIALQECQQQQKDDKVFKESKSQQFLKEHEQYHEIQDLKAQLQDKGIAICELKKLIEKLKGKSVETKFEKPSVIRQPNAFKRVIPTTSVSRAQLKSTQLEDRVLPKNSQGKKQEVEDHRRNFKFSNNKTSITACNDSLNVKTSNVNFVCVSCGKCVVNDNHDMCVFHYLNGVNARTKQPIVVLISTKETKRKVNQSTATPLKKTVASEPTIKKPTSIVR
ncbi:hypothetical protein Tco_1428445 [Tanacetum coccineum]